MGRAEKIFKKEGLACKDIEKLKQTVGKLQKKNPSILLKVTNWNLNSTCCFIIEPNGECWFYYANKKEFVGSLLKNSLDEIWNNFKSKDLVNYLINLR
jgi:fructose-1,6-bisphosphatase